MSLIDGRILGAADLRLGSSPGHVLRGLLHCRRWNEHHRFAIYISFTPNQIAASLS